MLTQRRRRWANISSALGQRLVTILLPVIVTTRISLTMWPVHTTLSRSSHYTVIFIMPVTHLKRSDARKAINCVVLANLRRGNEC